MIEIKSAVFGMLENNCYLITDKASAESALVDCTDDSKKMMDFISDTDLKYIFLTHGHFDHIEGVKAVKEKTEAKVVISSQDAPMLSSSKLSLATFSGIRQENTQPDIIVNDGDIVTLGESEIRVMSTPGHTKGSVCYLCDDSIFSGDTLFFCSCGRTDFPGGSDAEMSSSLKRLAALERNYTVYAGHGRNSTLDYERKNNPYMR